MREKECYCHTCEKPLHSMGVARHRAMHRDKRERCEISTVSRGREVYDYSKSTFQVKRDD